MTNLHINNNMAKQMKQLGFFGDYILAKRLQPSFRYSEYSIYSELPLNDFIDNTLKWADTPQGGKFWVNLHRKLLISEY